MKVTRIILGFMVLLFGIGCKKESPINYTGNSALILDKIFEFYSAGHKGLFNETYPYQEENKATYLAGEDTLKGKRVAYLWPTSGVMSGVVALLKVTEDADYALMLEKIIVPGLDNYYDAVRQPACYQSYIVQAGFSDRFYDDNVWLALDFQEAFSLTGKENYLKKSLELWDFIISGWDNEIGGIYWCEQKKESRNTCSNAPGAVLALKLFESTDSLYFKEWGIKLYNWTKENLQDTTDCLYFDNIRVDGAVDKAKYTYNSGQMMQAAALLYKITGNEIYLNDAQNIAQSAIHHFTHEFVTPQGKTIQLFNRTDNWFNAILLRGYAELFSLDNNPTYINIFRDNLEHIWLNARDQNSLFSKDWSGKKQDEYKWLLDQAAMVEMYAVMGLLEPNSGTK